MNGRCPHCGKSLETPPEPQAPPLQPDALEFREDGSGQRYSYRWWSATGYFLIVWCLIWDGVIALIYGAQLAHFWKTGEIQWAGLIFPLIHLAVGVAMTYYLATLFCNRTVLEVSRGRLKVRFTPLPWPGSVDIDCRDLHQLYVVQREHRSRGSVYLSYDLNAEVRQGNWLKLIGGIRNPAVARFLEYQLERYLNIENRPVEGEWPGSTTP